MSKIKRILLVEDDVNLGFLLVEFLESNEFDVKLYKDGLAGIEAFRKMEFDFCIFDVMLPKLDGFELAKAVKKHDPIVPIIMLTARAADEDKIRGFNIGVDDYMTKPFNETELLCRIKAVLARMEMTNKSQIKVEDELIYTFGKFSFDTKERTLECANEQRRLTKTEADILRILCRDKNIIVHRNELMKEVWGEDDFFIGRSLDVFVSKIRKYLSEDANVNIETIPNLGLVLKVK